ncbi:hypothetical protein L3081_24950 [Colwellia sp. MSW7]|uniref:Uncharacterized protein n=1 Tax=Colwellia maritima TaxID=2912588 RepID=A0ABS9X777_9GAMM|nr:hypothetical protein [Colwellia maritima]MCI2286074.1 hypothetical protein [Colwellia maritima]
MNDYLWETEEELSTNDFTMLDYLDYHMDESWTVLFLDGSYAEVKTDTGLTLSLHASGNGDFKSHKIEFKEL